MNSRGGKLDNGSGQLTENSRNCTINKVDTLEKRLGFIRGFNERFGSVVCGLHTYIDNCGTEWMLVVSDQEIAIRQPFVVPTFTNDDSYPLDDFSDVAGLSEENWRNTALYVASGGALQRSVGDSTTSPFDAASFLRWFKGARALSYQVTIQYEFDTIAETSQVASIVIKGNGDLTTGRRLQLDIELGVGNTYIASLYKADPTGALTLLGQRNIIGATAVAGGFMTLSYERNFDGPVPEFIVRGSVTPTGGGEQVVSLSGETISEIEDSEFGQISAIGCSQTMSILQVTGGPV